jgi:hypothetical protein
MLSLFLLWPTGSTLGLVLAVLGTGIWLGVQHLGYLEFGELRRVAQRTIEQRHIFVNNLAIRRATEELKVAEGFHQVGRILVAAFDSNDFDGFELRTETAFQHGLQLLEADKSRQLRWSKQGVLIAPELGNVWSISLDLISSRARHCGNLTIFRHYSNRDLQLDINLLTASFAMNLAEALQRAASQEVEFLPSTHGEALLSAQAG